MTFKWIVKFAAAIVVIVGWTIGNAFVLDKVSETVAAKLADWVNK